MSTGQGTVAHCEDAGIEVVLEESYPQKATDVSSVLTRIRDLNPDMLIGGSYLPDSVLIVRQAKELEAAADALETRAGDVVLLAENLRVARSAFDRLTGRAGVEDVLDALFSRFCLGK